VKRTSYEAPNYAVSPSVPPLPLRSKYCLQLPVLKHLNLRPHIIVKDQVSHPYKTKGKIMVLYILIFTIS